MKRLIGMVLVLAMFVACASAANAADMGVQVIGGPETETEPVSLDDIKLSITVEIPNYGIILPASFEYVDTLIAFKEGQVAGPYNEDIYQSGADAEYALLRMDITNLRQIDKNFLEQCDVTVVFDEKYEYKGWYHQYNYNIAAYNQHFLGGDVNVINQKDWFSIGQMYQGHYAFGCTLPNAVVESKAPLRMIIMIDGNEITYNIRK